MTWNTLRNAGRVGLTSIALAVILSPGMAAASTHPSSAQQSSEVRQPIVARPEAGSSGILSWLESFLPDGMRFLGPVSGAKIHPELLAKADCYNSGAGISCQGFRNLEEYLAAVRASQNLGIPFQKLKERIQRGRSLHQAIRELRPGVNAQIESWKAEQQALQMLKNFSS